jgi:hypothetical protein
LRRPRSGQPGVVPIRHPNRASEITMLTILLIIIIVLLLTGGGFGYSRRGRRL